MYTICSLTSATFWLTNFKSVTTGAAKTQQILPNPQKLAGQCGKLKCCLNFECEVYADALKKFPPANTPIRFKEGLAFYKKTDVFRGIMWYAYEGKNELVALTAESVKEIIEMNRNQQYPEKLEDFQVELMSDAALEQETSTAEFERELKLMADDQESAPQQSSDNRQQGGGERPAGRRDNSRHDNNRPRNNQGSRGDRNNQGPRNNDRNNDRARQDDRRRQNEMRQRADNKRPQEVQRTRNNPQRRSSDRDKRSEQ